MSLHKSLSKKAALIFLTYVTFSIDFRNIYNDYLLANVIDSFLLLFWLTKAISPARRLRISHPSVHVPLDIVLTKYDKTIS